jgi:hypothetical protein
MPCPSSEDDGTAADAAPMMLCVVHVRVALAEFVQPELTYACIETRMSLNQRVYQDCGLDAARKGILDGLASDGHSPKVAAFDGVPVTLTLT